MKTYDVIIAGLGAMGSAAAFHCARRGLKVLALDQFRPPHAQGSSHGLTRIIREAYFEHPSYVPLVQRAYVLWQELEECSGRNLLLQTGGVMMGPPDGALVRGALQSAESHGLPFELLGAQEVSKRFPALRPSDDMVAVYESRAGLLYVEPCVQAHLDLAQRLRADLRFEEKILRWNCANGNVRIQTEKEVYEGGRLVLAAGPWLPKLLPEHAARLQVERQTQFWFDPVQTPEFFRPERCPVYIVQPSADGFFYGFPDVGSGVKVARHHEGSAVPDPERVAREVRAEETAAMRVLLERFLPAANGPLRDGSVCLYTNTPDGHFWIDTHPGFPHVLIASPCSGHGFKFSSVIGELAGQWAAGQASGFDLELFRNRF